MMPSMDLKNVIMMEATVSHANSLMMVLIIVPATFLLSAVLAMAFATVTTILMNATMMEEIVVRSALFLSTWDGLFRYHFLFAIAISFYVAPPYSNALVTSFQVSHLEAMVEVSLAMDSFRFQQFR